MIPIPDAPESPARLTTPWREAFKMGAFAWVLSLFMACPAFSSWSWHDVSITRAADFLRLSANPLARNLTEDILAYRVATPFIAWVTHLPAVAALSLAYVFSLAALIVLHRAISQRSNANLASAAVIAVGCSSTLYYTHNCLGIPDSLTHLCTAIAMISSAPVAVVAVFIGFANDERAILALPFLTLWRLPALDYNWRTKDAWFALIKAAIPLALGLSASLVLRHALKAGWIGPGISSPPLYTQMGVSIANILPWLGSWGVWFANWLNGAGWLWIVMTAPLISSRWRPHAIPAIILGVSILAACISTFIVADAARSIGFAFPAALVALIWVYQRAPATAQRLILFIAICQVITPAGWIYQRWQFIQFRPLPWELWLYLHS